MLRRAVATLAAIALLSAAAPARAQALVTDLPIPTGGTERAAFLPAPAAGPQ